jgi:LysR family glycine cleavage system transcriptional activator
MKVQPSPLAALQAFEAAGRRMTFRHAADELNVTPSAISHRIRALEEHLEVRLFRRLNRGLILTDAGLSYFASVQDIFVRIQKATSEVAGRGSGRKLTIHSVPSLGSLWLMPWLQDFISHHPDVDLRVSASPEPANFVTNQVDVDIRYGRPIWKGVQFEALLTETVAPLCSPKLLKGPPAISCPEDIAKATLIELEGGVMGWDDWFELNGIVAPEGNRRLHFDRSIMSIQASVDGLGIILDSTTLARREIETGRLVIPFNDRIKSLEVTSHYLVYPKGRVQASLVRDFLVWLRRRAGEPFPVLSL